MSRELVVDEIRKILNDGTFELLIGAVETQILECKSVPYLLTELHQKQELAKDVSGLANADGGFILLGVRTQPNVARAEDEVAEIKPFSEQLFNPKQYEDVLKEWLHPAVVQVELKWLKSSTDGSKGIGAIFVPQQAAERGPFLITRTLDEGKKAIQTVFGYAERRRSSVDPMSVQRLHALIQTGTRFTRSAQQIENIEQLLEKVIARSETEDQKPSVPIANPVTDTDFVRIMEQAVTAADLADKPSFVLGARPSSQTDMPTLFRSKNEEVVKLLEHPPQFVPGGFNLRTGAQAQMLHGSLRRAVAPGNSLLELWRNGSLIFVGRGDEAFLCWPPPIDGVRKEELTVHAVAVLELLYQFIELSKLVYAHALPKPEDVEYSVWLIKLTREKPSRLAIIGGEGSYLIHTGSPAPTSHFLTRVPANITNTETGAITFNVASKVFEWYGVEHDRIPYQKNGSIDREMLIKI